METKTFENGLKSGHFENASFLVWTSENGDFENHDENSFAWHPVLVQIRESRHAQSQVIHYSFSTSSSVLVWTVVSGTSKRGN